MMNSIHDDLGLTRYVDDLGSDSDWSLSPMASRLWQSALAAASEDADMALRDIESDPECECIFDTWYRLSAKARRHYESVCAAGREDLIPDVLEREDVSEWVWEREFGIHLETHQAWQRRDDEVLAAYRAAKDRLARWEDGDHVYA